MTGMKHTLTAVTLAALLAAPAFGQSTHRSGDQSGSESSSAQVARNAPETNETRQSRTSSYATMEAMDGPSVRADYNSMYVNNMSELAATLMQENVDFEGAYTGKEVRTRDGIPIGTVSGVYGRVDGRTALVVSAHEDLNIPQSLFSVSLPSEMESDTHFTVPMTRASLANELSGAFDQTPR